MRLVHDYDPPRTRDEEAGAWCARIATGALGSEEQADFDRWTAADKANAAAFDQALHVWQCLHAASETPEVISMRADALEALRRANVRRPPRIGSGWQRPFAMAASLAVILLTGLFLFLGQSDQYSTGTGERRAVLLADGSRLSLDAETKVLVDYQKDQRRLTLLGGRAKFDVAEDLARPFTVTAGGRTVVATGTAFSVELLNRKVHVIVYEGNVAVLKGTALAPDKLLQIKARPEGRVAVTSLAPGKQLIAAQMSDAPPQVSEAEVGRSLAWEGGQLDFVDEPLASVVTRLNRYSTTKVTVADAATAAIQVNGVFNAGDSEAFVEAVAAAYGLKASTEQGRIVVSSR